MDAIQYWLPLYDLGLYFPHASMLTIFPVDVGCGVGVSSDGLGDLEVGSRLEGSGACLDCA